MKSIEMAVLLKYWSNFYRTLEMLLINFEINVLITCLVDCGIPATTGATTCAIAGTKLYAPLMTLSNQYNTKQLQQLKSGFKCTIIWNKCQSKISL